MLSKKYRFHRQNDVRRVYRDGASVRTKHVSLKYLRQRNPKDSRIAVVVSKKVDKKAVTRNRIRRRIYEIIRKSWSDVAQGYDLVFTVHNKSLSTKTHQQLESEIKELLAKTKTTN